MKIVKLYDVRNATNPYLVAEMDDGSYKCVCTDIAVKNFIRSYDFSRTGRSTADLVEIPAYQYSMVYVDAIAAFNGR